MNSPHVLPQNSARQFAAGQLGEFATCPATEFGPSLFGARGTSPSSVAAVTPPDIDHRQTAQRWLSAEPDDDLRAELVELLEGPPEVLAERFTGRLEFGTAGLRAAVGAGPQRTASSS